MSLSTRQLEVLRELKGGARMDIDADGRCRIAGTVVYKNTLRSLEGRKIIARVERTYVMAPLGERILRDVEDEERRAQKRERRYEAQVKTWNAIVAALKTVLFADRSTDSLYALIEGRVQSDWVINAEAFPQVSLSWITSDDLPDPSVLGRRDFDVWIQVDVWGDAHASKALLIDVFDKFRDALDGHTGSMLGYPHVWIGCTSEPGADYLGVPTIQPRRLLSEWLLIASHRPIPAKEKRYRSLMGRFDHDVDDAIRGAVARGLESYEMQNDDPFDLFGDSESGGDDDA